MGGAVVPCERDDNRDHLLYLGGDRVVFVNFIFDLHLWFTVCGVLYGVDALDRVGGGATCGGFVGGADAAPSGFLPQGTGLARKAEDGLYKQIHMVSDVIYDLANAVRDHLLHGVCGFDYCGAVFHCCSSCSVDLSTADGFMERRFLFPANRVFALVGYFWDVDDHERNAFG